jgi:hypothetical protein
VAASVTGDPAVFVSVSAAHQGLDGDGPTFDRLLDEVRKITESRDGGEFTPGDAVLARGGDPRSPP